MEHRAGVYTATKKNGDIYYRSSITYRAKHISLGSFDDIDTAARSYDEANELLNSDTKIEDYNNGTHVLAFEKWVSLINFRDNRMYIKTPIYMKSNYFLYYYSEHEIYTFDVDDLFYYSRHKIMKRGGHLFVAEYGMQVNIMSRYGIKNYAVEGRDYIFINGDHMDYRYSNIEVINKYQGVRIHTESIPAVYSSRIHINGDFIIGKYKTENEAAIAYNKAVDYLLTKGLQRNYQKNYIIDLSSKEYHEIYESIKLPKKIRALTF